MISRLFPRLFKIHHLKIPTYSFYSLESKLFCEKKAAAKKTPPPKKDAPAEQSNKPDSAGSATVEKKTADKSVKGDKVDPTKKEELKLNTVDDKYKELFEGVVLHWEKIAQKNSDIAAKRIEKELTNGQKEYIDVLARKFANFNVTQIAYFYNLLSGKLEKIQGFPLLSVNKNWKSLLEEFPMTGDKPQYPKEKEVFENLQKMMGVSAMPAASSSSGESTGSGKTEGGNAAAAETKKEEKKEKEAYDIELTSFDPAKKIVLIKEVKNLLNLGLKEAKELVEKAPTLIMKSVKKADVEAIMNKLKDNGGTLKLV